MRDKLRQLWLDAQKIIDLKSDTWMGLFTLLILVRIALVLRGHQALSASEAATYASAIGCFAYSNRGDK